MKKDKTYAELKSELTEILAKMEDPEISLDDLIELHKTGEKILKKLDGYLLKMREQMAGVLDNN